jgi:DNA repair exonuclease SbcCD ATPase subunit
MKVELTNFKCHDFKEIEFNENNVILISGKSGVGKTSIIEAIVFVLFGSGRKITKYGQKSCSVRLQITIIDKILDIKRTKGPNRLTLEYSTKSDPNWNHYEDAAAQSIISEVFGYQYESVGYLSQSSINSFVLMGPQEKLTFLDNLIFKTSDLKDIKQKIHNLVKERTQLLQTTVGKVEMLTQIINEETVDNKYPEFPIHKKSGASVFEEYEQMLIEKNLITEHKNITKRINNIDNKLHKLNNMLKEREEEQNVIDHHTKMFDNLNTRFTIFEEQYKTNNSEQHSDIATKISNYICNINKDYKEVKEQYDENLTKLKNIKEYEQYCKIRKEIDEKTKQYDETYSLEKVKLTTDLENYKKSILSISEIDEYKTEINENNEFCLAVEKYKEYCIELKDLNSLLNLKLVECSKYFDIMIESENKEQSLQDILSIISKYEKFFDDKIMQYDQDIEILTEQLQKVKLEEKQYTCPKCFTKLSLNISTTTLECVSDNKLDDDQDTLTKKLHKKDKKNNKAKQYHIEIKQIKTNALRIIEKINSFENTYDKDDLNLSDDDIDAIKERTYELQNTIRGNSDAIVKYKETKHKLKQTCLDNHLLTGLYNDIAKLSKIKEKLCIENDTYDTLDMLDSVNMSSDILTESSVSMKYKLDKYENDQEKIIQLQTDLIKYQDSVNKFNKENSTNDKKLSLMSIKKHIELNNTEKDKYVELLQDNINNQHLIDKWKIKYAQYKKITQQKSDLVKLEECIVETKQKLQSIYKLKDFVKNAETTLLQRAINQINQHVDNYLDIFFQTDPITIRLYVKEDEKSASRNGQLNLSVDYKGMDADLSILSGGELQRVVIAYNLALSEIFSVPLILLDECTSNLDQELTEIVVKGIKYNCKGKTMIMIAHQVVSGIFDNVISIS